MHIQQTQTSFNGGFLFRNMPQEAKNKLPEITKKGKQIFDNFQTKGDVFLVLRDQYDKKALGFIKEHKLQFEYYPEISTRSGLDSEEPEGLIKLLGKYKYTPINSIRGTQKVLSNRRKLNNIESTSPEYISKILRALCIDNPGSSETKLVKGASIVDDKEFSRKIIISPPSKHNIHFVCVEPYSSNAPSKRYAIDSDGNILARYSTPEGIRMFQENLSKLLIK